MSKKLTKQEQKEELLQSDLFKKVIEIINNSDLVLPLTKDELTEAIADYIVGIKNPNLQKTV